MTIITKKEACDLLQIKAHTLRNLINSSKVIEVNKKEVKLSSVLECQKEFEERRSTSKSVWICTGGYASL